MERNERMKQYQIEQDEKVDELFDNLLGGDSEE